MDCNLRGYSWKEHEGKLFPGWFQDEPLPTLKEIETLNEASARDTKLKKGDEYMETVKTMTANNNRFCMI